MGLAWLSESVFARASGLTGSPHPLWPWPHGWPLRSSPLRAPVEFEVHGKTLVALRSPPELDCPGAAAHESELSPTTASPAVCSPSASSRCPAATHPGGTSPGYVPPQRFSRSRGLSPPDTCRPCFVPVPPLGFCPSGSIPPAEPSALSSAPCPLAVGESFGRCFRPPARHRHPRTGADPSCGPT
jgi:hypothetical protein